DAILALLLLVRHDGMRAWKGFDWSAMDRLHAKGLISNPAGKAKSVVLTDEGLRRAEALFQQMVAKSQGEGWRPSQAWALPRAFSVLSFRRPLLRKQCLAPGWSAARRTQWRGSSMARRWRWTTAAKCG